jgi:SpoVK/Ycf46/Vps4 family AAA+-type ATPase
MSRRNNANNVNNYNNFLKSLDNTNLNNNDLKDKPVTLDKPVNVTLDTPVTLDKEVIDILIKMIQDKYTNDKLDTTNFTGLYIEKDDNWNMNKKDIENKERKIVIEKEKEIVPIVKTHINIDVEINNINDILELIDKYKIDRSIKYNINLKALHNIKEPLIELNNMIGMKEFKTNIVDQILYFVQDLHKGSNGDFMHTVIYGPPGTGKTEIAKIMGKIYSKLGVLNKGTFKKVVRSDLIAGFLGQTAIKTRDVIKECIGGVLFIDEAYALGNNENKDIFSKECIDTLCEALSDHKHELMVIIAGYETELKDCFFNYNQGLDSRFTWRFKTDEYNAEDLRSIFIKKVNENGWSIVDDIDVLWFKKNMAYFKFFGRDMETLLAKVKISHGKRVFCKSENERKKIVLKDMENGLKLYLSNDNVKSRKDNKRVLNTMYV